MRSPSGEDRSGGAGRQGAPAAPAMSGPDRPERRPGLAQIAVFATAGIPLAAVTTAISIYLPRHFARHVGISLAAVGTAFAIVRLLDIWVDLLLGLAMDRTRTPWGRYRAWMLAGTPVLLLAVYFLFVHPGHLTMTSLIAWLLVLYLGTSILGLAQSAWAAILVTNYDDRSRAFGLMAALGIVGSLAVFLAPVVLHATGHSDNEAMGWIIIVATPLAVGLVAATTPERVRSDIQARRFRLRDYWDLISRPTMLRILLADFCLALGPGWLSATVLFLLMDARSFSLVQANVLLIVAISAGFAGAPAAARVAIRLSKHRALMFSALGYAASLIGILETPKRDMMVAVPVMFMVGFFAAAFAALLRSMTADVADELRLEQGRERAGLLYAITTLTTKIAGAFSIYLTLHLLERVGFDAKAGAANTPGALRGLEIASIAGPIGFVMLGAACCLGYGLTAERHAQIRRELDEREGGVDGAPRQTISAEPIVGPPSL
jgi:GPH family glycoside/pentoside/hexuronide:cation symporter